jgi:hypothetical protein
MSIVICKKCNRAVDTDYYAEFINDDEICEDCEEEQLLAECESDVSLDDTIMREDDTGRITN